MKKTMNRIFRSIGRFFYDFIKLFSVNKIFISGCFVRKRNSFVNNNWGDDINIHFIQDISNVNVLIKNCSCLYNTLPIKAYNCIGSIIGLDTDKHTSIWGSGLMRNDMPIPHKPQKVYSVRGPLTRRELLNRGIDCPEVYGDPGLLVSRYYRPRVIKKYDLGIIPHYVDEDNPVLEKFCKLHPEVLIIHMRGYKHWHDIPDQILSCRKIISSSLHGLILSDSYGVPNSWVRLSNKISGGDFKYLDYFASVGRLETNPHIIANYRDLEEIFDHNRFELATSINYDVIFNACPFKDKLKKYWDLIPKIPQYGFIDEKKMHFAECVFVDTEEQLDKFLFNLRSLEGSYLFRGMNDARFKMYSSSQRHWAQNTDMVYRIGESDYYIFIQSLVNKSKELYEVKKYASKQSIHPNDLFCLALLQHFGAPSPMLDFTHSIYESLYFAIDGLVWDGNETCGLEDYMSVYYIPKSIDWINTTDCYINFLQFGDPMLSQEDMFIMNNTIDKPLVELMNEITKNKYFRCVNIHKKLATYIIDQYLTPKGINHATVYCDGDSEVEDMQKAIDII